MNRFSIEPLFEKDLENLRLFTDRAIGEGYYSLEELRESYLRMAKAPICSFTLKNQKSEILGVRLTFAPGTWQHGKGDGLTMSKWPHSINETGYFQSLFLAPELRGQGWGRRLSERSIVELARIGAKGVVCHSWKESPENSSYKYLLKMGFRPVAEHPLYWQHVNYNCTRCLKPPCQCTAIEMYYEIS